MRLQHIWPVLCFIVLMLVSFLVPLQIFLPAVKAAVLYDSGNPTSEEQLVLEYVNRARSNPVAEGQRLGIDIHEGLQDPSLVGPRPPLAMNKILLSLAEAHSQNMYNLNYYSHNDPNGATPFQRMANAGYNYLLAGENIAGSTDYAAATVLEDFMMVDSGTAGRGHRVNLLSVDPYPCNDPPCVYSEIGIGYYEGANANNIGLTSLITEDFGATGAGPFLLGVVYNDLNHNNFYDIGEGITGVTITPSTGNYYAVSSSSGGYVIPVGTSGTITVTASGPGFGSITKTVTFTGVNVKVDFTTSMQQATTTSTLLQTSTTATSRTSVTATSSSPTTSSIQTTTTVVYHPSIALNPTSAPAGSMIIVSGSGFSPSDTSCSFTGVAIESSQCSVTAGTLTGSFVTANIATGSYAVAATGRPAGDWVTVTFQLTSTRSLTLNPSAAEVGGIVTVYGSGFASSDSTCQITGTGGSVASFACAITGGNIAGSFVVANVPPAVYAVTVIGVQNADSASIIFTVKAASTQTNTTSLSTSSQIIVLSSTSSTTTLSQSTTVSSTSTAASTTLTITSSNPGETSSASSSVSTPVAMPSVPIPGFPWESVIVGIIVGMVALTTFRHRRK